MKRQADCKYHRTRGYTSRHRRCFSHNCCSAGTCCDTRPADARIRKSNILDGLCSSPGNQKRFRRTILRSMKCRLSDAGERYQSTSFRCACISQVPDCRPHSWILSYTFRYIVSSRSLFRSSRSIRVDGTLQTTSRRHMSVYSLPLRQKAAAVPESLLPS